MTHVLPAPAVQVDGLAPRPPAGVLGGDWSAWLFLAGTLFLVAAAIGVWWWSRRGRADDPEPGSGASDPRSARETALAELERIRGEGWHRNGRMTRFYTASTDVLRSFHAQVEPPLHPSLTSRELIRALRAREGDERVAGTTRAETTELGALADAVTRAERVKFGVHRPDPEDAERDWRSIRHWIRSAPEDG